MNSTLHMFDVTDKVAVVTGGTGVLGGEMARALAAAGARVGILGRREEMAQRVVAQIEAAGGQAVALPADVLDEAQLVAARETLLERWGRLDILVNAAGGNLPGATLTPENTFFDLQPEAFQRVVDLNLVGTVLPSQIFGAPMAEPGERLHHQYLLHGRAARDHARGGLLRCKSRRGQLHPLARH